MAKTRKINQKEYRWYVLSVLQQKIIEGFEYEGDAKARVREMIEEGDYLGKMKVYTKAHLVRRGLDPDQNTSWGSDNFEVLREQGLVGAEHLESVHP